MSTTDPFGNPGRGPDAFGSPGSAAREYADAEARAAQNLPIDQWGRYRIPSPDGIQPAVNKGRTRVSTTKGVGQDQSRIQARAERLIVKGLAADPALAARAAEALKLEDDSKAQRKALAAVAGAAFVAAGGDDRRDQGTEVHQIIDDILKGNAPEVPEKYQRDVAAYFEALEKHGLEPVPGLSELVVFCPFEHGGAIDNIMRWWNPDTEMYELVVVDTKTGRTLDNSRVEFLSQTWMYSNALYAFTVTGMDRDKDGKLTSVRGHIEDLPMELRRDKAIIVHLPMDGTVEVVLLDLSGWDRVVAAQIEIRRANAEAKYRYRSLGVIRPEAFIQPSNWAERGNLPQGAAVVPTDGSVQPIPLAAPVVPWAVETGDGRDAPTPISVPTDAVIQGKHLAGTVRHTEQLGRPGTTPIDMSAGQFTTEAIKTPPVKLDPPVERDPVTNRKKRTCGFCHHSGHTQKNCPENPASAKYVSQGTTQTGVDDDGIPYSREVPTSESGHAEPATDGEVAQPVSDQARANVEAALAEAPFCTLAHACQWTSSHQAAPGHWVCSVSGKPGRAAYELGQTAITNQAPFYGAPGNVVPEFQAEVLEAVKLADDKPFKVGEPLPPAAWVPPPSLLDLIAQCSTQSAVLALRQTHLEAGTWTLEHDAAGMNRYQALTAS